MSGEGLTVPEQVTFEQAIALSRSLSQLEPREVESVTRNLVKTENGARGFFVTYLTSDQTLADNPSPEVVRALQSSPEIVADLLVKNLAMSSAMAVAHRRNQNEEMAQSSERVRDRTARLIQLVHIPAINDLSQQLAESAATGEGNYKAFLNRWRYDPEQRQVIREVLQQIISSST